MPKIKKQGEEYSKPAISVSMQDSFLAIKFKDICHNEGLKVSNVIGDFIKKFVEDHEKKKRAEDLKKE